MCIRDSTYDRSAAKGFMDLYGLPNKVWAQRTLGQGAPCDAPAAACDPKPLVVSVEPSGAAAKVTLYK